MERTREEVAILLNGVWNSAVIDIVCVNSRPLWIKLKFSRVKVCMAVGYGSYEGESEERNKFWNDMDMIPNRVGNGYILCILGDLIG